MCWNARYAVLIAISTFLTYVAGILIEKLESRAAKKWVVIDGFALNNVNKLLVYFYIQTIQNPFDLLLPVGIYFILFKPWVTWLMCIKANVKRREICCSTLCSFLFSTVGFATSIADFWRRWHISLSTWFRDYLYIPLGGNRGNRVRKYINLMITLAGAKTMHGRNTVPG